MFIIYQQSINFHYKFLATPHNSNTVKKTKIALSLMQTARKR